MTNDLKQYIDFKQPPNSIRLVVFSSRYLSKNKEFESTAVGGEGAGSVGQDPVHLLSHPFVECVLHLFQAYLIVLWLNHYACVSQYKCYSPYLA